MARKELIAACALIGALGGALFGATVAPPHHSYRGSWEAVIGFALCTALSATLLGFVLARRPAPDTFDAVTRAVGFSFVFGALNAALMVASMSILHGRPSGGAVFMVIAIAAVVGAICAVPFIPAIIAVAVTAHDATARGDSIAEHAQRRRVLRVAAMSLALAGLVVPVSRIPIRFRVPAYVTGLALLILATLLAIELAAWRSLRHANQTSIDYGVGDELIVTRAYDETYRCDAVVASVVKGSRETARAIAGHSLRGHAIALAIALSALAIQLR